MMATDGFSIESLDGRGRGVVSRRPLNGGDVIMQEIPLASVVLEEWAAYVCHQCFCMVPRLASCAACKQVGWCSEECERIGAVAHRAGGSHCECDALKRLDADVLRDGDTALAKLFVKLLCRRVVEAGAGGAEGMVDSSLALLESNEDAIGDDRISDIAMIAEVVLDAVHPAARIEQEELEGYMCAEQCNSFGIWGETGSGRDKLLGFGIFPRLCMFNHSCLPNVTISQTVNNRVRTLTAHTLAPVAAGDELCISYSEAKLLDDREARRAWLRKTYLFECACVLCCAPEATATDLVRHFNARHRCREKSCAGLLYPSKSGARAGGQDGDCMQRVCNTCHTAHEESL